jgi:hypothetical protein
MWINNKYNRIFQKMQTCDQKNFFSSLRATLSRPLLVLSYPVLSPQMGGTLLPPVTRKNSSAQSPKHTTGEL